jgi:hypothetical protein
METPTTGRMLLPVSIAMKRYETEYLHALQCFSKPARHLWDVQWFDQDRFTFRLNGDGAIYRYWDATKAVEFSLQMAKEALREDLQTEVKLLMHYDAIYRKVDTMFDVRSSDLSLLVLSCLQNAGVVSKNRRKQFAATVPGAVFDAIEQAWSETASPMLEVDSASSFSQLTRHKVPDDALRKLREKLQESTGSPVDVTAKHKPSRGTDGPGF